MATVEPAPPPAPASTDSGGATLVAYTREVTEAITPGEMHEDFVAAAAALNPLLRRALVDDCVDSTPGVL